MAVLTLLLPASSLWASDTLILIQHRYLNLPVSQKSTRQFMHFELNGRTERTFKIRLANSEPEYWVFADVSHLKGKNLKIHYDGTSAGMKSIYQSDAIAGADSLYLEKDRPRLHFTTRRGWINDPNGLVWYKGQYHLFYQHNPYENQWENMHWGHAVSPDLVHWKELPVALRPDSLGTMFSGSVVIDRKNSAGFNSDSKVAMVAAYTAASASRQVQCIAFSLDEGLTWTKYAGNPVIDSKARWHSVDTRDPRLFWFEPGRHWVMVLNERDGHSVYNSANLKDWTYQSHITGFWECPDLFELPVEGQPRQRKWVLLGASNTYMVGRFDGKKFTPESGKHYFTGGSIYAAQTFNNVPDGRRIQIGWGRINFPGAAFNGQMLIPTELRLRPTRNGLRIFSQPVAEYESLFRLLGHWKNLDANRALQLLDSIGHQESFRLRFTLHLSHATAAGLELDSQRLLDYDMNYNRINGIFYSPDQPGSMEIIADVYVDRHSIEVFIDQGAYSYSLERRPENTHGLAFFGQQITIKNLEIFEAASIWQPNLK
ncbi:glycoside hydrolase family 32 protein [Niabella terrae]